VKTSGWKATYTRDEIDFIIVYIVPENLWYVVPIAAAASRKGLRFYPHGGRNGLLEKYREAWCQMACPRLENGPSQILVPRLCQQPRTRRRPCPLCS